MVAAIYNIFDGLELLPYSVSNIQKCVDGIIFVYQDESNYGEFDEVGTQVRLIASTVKCPVHIEKYHPILSWMPADNERRKREIGLKIAQKLGYTHFLDIDCDEFYNPDEFLKEKDRVLSKNLNGLVCRSKVFFGSPELTIGTDVTLVSFLNKVDCSHVLNRNMPYGWSSMDGVPFTPKKQIRIDPTRQLSFTSGIEWSEIFMYHFSWVRKDFKKKINNSSARKNIERSTILQDLLSAKEGHFCEFYGKQLIKCPNVFGLPEWQKEIQTTPSSSRM